MKKVYNFVCMPNGNNLTLDNPLSSMRVTLRGAWAWAEKLIDFNYSCERVQFRAENGRKIYCRENDKSGG